MHQDPQAVLDRAAETPDARTLLDVLRATASRHPEASAIDDGSTALSYRELMAHVVRTAARLHEAGVRRGDRVGVRMPSGAKELYISILGVIAAGAAYVPVDADDPDERARLVFGEAAVRGVIGAGGVYVPAPGPPDERARLVFGEAAVRGVIGAGGVYVPAPGPASDSAPSPEEPESPAGAELYRGGSPHPSTHAVMTVPEPGIEDDAWIIFTSGSTGVPKGVAVSHRSAAAFVDAEARMFLQDAPLGPGDRVLAGLSVAFDAS
ncbi:MAG: amino acid adenylation protein, partial [Microbacterium sp.]|nr:amino acid adenylation protein [Microbacterium sp.]